MLEDEPLDAELVRRELKKSGVDHELLIVRNRETFQKALYDFPADIILSDHSLPQFSSTEALKIIKSIGLEIPFILITSTMTDEFAVKIMKEGADDYIIKDRLSRLPSAIYNAIQKFRLVSEKNAERIRINDELRSLNHRLQLATKSADLGIWDWDIDAQILKWDEGMYKLYHVEDAGLESLYDTWVSSLHFEDRDRVLAELQMALVDEKKYDTEFKIVDDQDRIYDIKATGIVERDDSGLPLRMIGICWDTTKQKSAAQEREEIIKEMSQRNVELEQFSYIISHNLRSPVANIIGASTLLCDIELPVDDRMYLLEAVHQSAIGLDNIIRDMNRIIELKDGIYVKEAVSLSTLVAEIKLSISDLLLDNEFKVNCDFSAVDELFSVKPYLYSIFYNLITNGVKYRRLDVKAFLTITSEQLSDKTVLLFTDNGIGFNLDRNKDNLFGLYKRFHSNYPGKGMGLFMVKSQVEMLGGSVSVESTENVGTTFKIEFKHR